MKLKECYKKYGKNEFIVKENYSNIIKFEGYSEKLPHVMKDLEVQYILDNKFLSKGIGKPVFLIEYRDFKIK